MASIHPVEPTPAEYGVLRQAAEALQDVDALRERVALADERVRDLCRLYDATTGARGTSPDGLRRACQLGGFL